MKQMKIISLIPGISMFLFGIIKFVNPFKEWYEVQIFKSGLLPSNVSCKRRCVNEVILLTQRPGILT